MKVSEIMSPHPLTVSPDQTLGEAAELMQRIDAGFLPVGEDDRLVGMLTDRDIAIRGVGAGKGPGAKVREVMTDDVCYCFEDEEIEAAARNMGAQQIRRVPVIDRDKRLVGVLSLGDIAVRQAAETAGDALEGIAQPSDLHG
ncbi:CBS domain-containing protein [Lutimaribacter pacificus]|uniref:CBS domain-containing protein n=1 Tax=Lutimaribacter pacificus TaxID=391948 RepID=A0A1H0LUH4_9RHOB|nr:CBS domain-containing protein [Lutimaribacter pacificus]SDO71858.1 CBS domain-containing protein [Lutimaribacter pacificus]SHK03060.1 CBS domain-containing protein [Lutimaribacter pacificus]